MESNDTDDKLFDIIDDIKNTNNLNDVWWNVLFIYLPPFILIQGIIGNLISFYVFFKLGKLKDKFKPDVLIKLSKLILTSIKTSNNATNNDKVNNSKNEIKLNLKNENKTSSKRNNNIINLNSTPGGLTIYLYLCLLAMFDLGVLLFGLLNEWIYSLTLFDLKNQSLFICKLFTFFAYLFSHLSSSTIVTTTAIRLIAIYRPLYASNLTSIRFVKLISFIQFLIFSVINLHLFWNMNLTQLDYHGSTLSLSSSLSSTTPTSLNYNYILSSSASPLTSQDQSAQNNDLLIIKSLLIHQQQKFNKTLYNLSNNNNSHLIYNNNNNDNDQTNDYNDIININGYNFISVDNSNEITTINNLNLKQCKIKTNFFTKSIWPIADKLIYCILPFLLITLFNILIIINISKVQKYKYTLYVSKLKNDLILQQQQQHQQLSLHDSIHNTNNNNNNNNEISINNSNNHKNDEANDEMSNKKKDLITIYNQHQQLSISSITQNQKEKTKLNIKEKIIQFKKYHLVGKKFTILLLAISFSFLVLTFPVVLTYILIDPLTKKFDKMEINESNFNFEIFGYIQKITELLMYLNHSINFYIYIVTSFRFRQQIKHLFKLSFFSSRQNKKYVVYFKCCFSYQKQKTHLYD